MAESQSAIYAETGDFGLFLTLTVNDGAHGPVRPLLASIPGLTQALAKRLGEPRLVSAVGIGAAAWAGLVGGALPPGLEPFAALADGPREVPSTPADLFLHIHSPRHDANFILARQIMARLSAHVRVVEEVVGFRHLGGRDLTGFVDGTENAKGDERAGVALVPGGPFAGGSYVSIQRYVHDLSNWERLDVSEQEGIVGRTKEADEEMDDAVKPLTAHIARVVIEENGAELEILRHSLPYGSTAEAGLYFVAYGASPAPFRKMLERMVLRDGDGHCDRLLEFSRAMTGAAFFTPSVEFLGGLT